MVDQLIQSFQGVPLLRRLKVLLKKDLFELLDGSIENGHCDLVVLDLRSKVVLKVRVPLLHGFLHDVMLVRLHFISYK